MKPIIKRFAVVSSVACLLYTSNAFLEMKKAAEADDIELWIQSGYRSYDRQKELYDESINSPDANKTDSLIAKPGYSEHQTGLSVDINSVTCLLYTSNFHICSNLIHWHVARAFNNNLNISLPCTLCKLT